MDIFELLHDKIQLKPPIRMFEAFSGIGSQAMALKRLGVDYEIIGYSEIDKYAIKSYHAIHGNIKPYGDITKMKEIPSCDIFTWSFPCTDLSKAGKQEGMGKDTRSGLIHEVLRLVKNTKDKPKVLIMENVPDLIQTKFVREFGEVQLELEKLGYMNYVEILNAKNYGVAQNRARVFMVSILGDYSYTFPNWVDLDKRLKDYLEDEVDEKYYLSARQLEQISNWNAQQNPIENAKSRDDDTLQCITAKSNTSMNASMLLIKEDTKQGYALAKDGDGVYINRPHQKRGVVQDGMIQTLKTSGNDIGVVVKSNKTICLNSQVNGKQPSVTENLRIRKLTPLECWRLMGIDDQDFHKAEKVCSNSQLYKQAGNAIVVDVFEAILRNLIKGE